MTAAVSRVVLGADAHLYHGTRSAGAFRVPDGPAWFAFDPLTAFTWAHWRSGPPAGRSFGPDVRVLVLRTVRETALLDLRRRDDWIACALALLGDAEPTTYHLADAVARSGEAGWMCEREVMLTRTDLCLEPTQISRRPD